MLFLLYADRPCYLFAAKDLIQHLLCVDPAQRYTIDEFLAHPWCTAAPPHHRHQHQTSTPLQRLSTRPLLTAVHGGRVEGRSPGLASLKEAFDITYAVHRMEEEGARRRAYNGRGGAGQRGFLAGLNEDDEDEDEDGDKEVEDARRKHGDVVGKAVQEGQRQVRAGGGGGGIAGVGQRNVARRGAVEDRALLEGGRAGQRDRGRRVGGGGVSGGTTTSTGNRKGFELDMDGATLLGRRHKKGGMDSSPLAGKPFGPRQGSEQDRMPPGSPMRVT